MKQNHKPPDLYSSRCLSKKEVTMRRVCASNFGGECSNGENFWCIGKVNGRFEKLFQIIQFLAFGA